MKRFQAIHFITISASFLAIILWIPFSIFAEDSDPERRVPEGVYIELTRDFYESLRDKGKGGGKVYSNDPSIEYLKEISISSRFMVETNLQILKQQERILQLLESLLEDKKK